MNSYSDLIKYLDKKTKLGIKFGLENINYLLKKLDSPHEKFHCIHIAGTNGKGSTAAMLSSILTYAGIKTGLYTSPHLVNVTERIRISEKDIAKDELLQVARKIIPLSLPETTYFELLTAMAIEYFYENNVEIAVMEAGMGGRLDATNACFGEIVIITDISLDHTQYLGNTIEEITKEKMAIVKPGSTVITAENLTGNYKERNKALALKAIYALKDKGFSIPKESVEKGLLNTRWPGRFQIIGNIILDGAHNPGAASALKEMIKEKVVLIIGILKDKDYKRIMEILTPVAKRVITVTPKSERALSGEVLMGLVKDRPVQYIPNVMDAVKSVKEDIPILVTGSLYLIGEVLSHENYNT